MTSPTPQERSINRSTFRGMLLIFIGLAGSIVSFIGALVEGWAPFRIVTIVLGLVVAALAAREVHVRRAGRT